MSTMFSTVLVANRGEIAVRVISTLRSMGIRSVAVYSDADAGAPHVKAADVAVRIGPAPAAESYLKMENILQAARLSGAEAIHPGYGFLSENAEFAAACEQAGVVFIGPREKALHVMGDKISSKQQVSTFGVPLVAGVSEPGLSDEQLIEAVSEMPYPLLIKPSAGGGGKGMVVVESPDELPEALAGARRVAARSFGDDTLFIEQFVKNPRHIEIQILADEYGNIIHLGERECSLQRRHQKVIEEAPSALLSVEARERMGQAACQAARSVDYRGAGTVEFLVPAEDPESFYFMEMNTRLQVEHPVTEEVTGVDLVQWQLKIAAGEKLTLRQEDVRLSGHSIEARVYAENPSRGFLPTEGKILAYEEPQAPWVRVDSGIVEGSTIGLDYDPMLAKVIVHGADRTEAIERLDEALSHMMILGVGTNIEYLRALMNDPDVRAARLDTGLIERKLPGMRFAESSPEHEQAARKHLASLLSDSERSRGRRAAGGGDVAAVAGPWRRDSFASAIALAPEPPSLAEEAIDAGEDTEIRVIFGQGNPERAEGIKAFVFDAGTVFELTLHSRAGMLAERLADLEEESQSLGPRLIAPMPGTVVAVYVQDGQDVSEGQIVANIEAMKMEHPVKASQAGKISLAVQVGEHVKLDQIIASIHNEDESQELIPRQCSKKPPQ